MRWWALGFATLAFAIFIFGMFGWWVMGREEKKLDDGDPNNPYTKEWKEDE
jgi:hypothetical protein